LHIARSPALPPFTQAMPASSQPSTASSPRFPTTPPQIRFRSTSIRPPKARKTPAHRSQPAEGPAGLSSRGFLAPSVAGGSPGTESRAPLADPAAATRRDRPLPRDPARRPAPARPPPTPRPGDGAGRGERTERSARLVALPPSPRPGTGDR
uniref:Classical arabinogalactan protein 9-like n=1 Tax=Callorhinus ursinus TaxID=34884 RepID=A0A3Q7NJC8_CALUR